MGLGYQELGFCSLDANGAGSFLPIPSPAESYYLVSPAEDQLCIRQCWQKSRLDCV